jgi:hypothetical protein
VYIYALARFFQPFHQTTSPYLCYVSMLSENISRPAGDCIHLYPCSYMFQETLPSMPYVPVSLCPIAARCKNVHFQIRTSSEKRIKPCPIFSLDIYSAKAGLLRMFLAAILSRSVNIPSTSRYFSNVQLAHTPACSILRNTDACTTVALVTPDARAQLTNPQYCVTRPSSA